MDNQLNPPWPEGMNTLSECLDIAGSRGYTAEFSVSEKGLCVAGQESYFKPDETHIHNFYRFEGNSDPNDMSILYLIETASGIKGTLIDAYGTYAESRISEFIKAVKDIHKSTS